MIRAIHCWWLGWQEAHLAGQVDSAHTLLVEHRARRIAAIRALRAVQHRKMMIESPRSITKRLAG